MENNINAAISELKESILSMPKKIKEALEKHVLWLEGKNGGERFVWLDVIKDMSDADMSDADMSGADMSGADMRRADMSGADMSGANMSDANMSDADMRRADMSGAKNLISAINYLEANFERTESGYIVYKTFGGMYSAPESWKIEPNAIIEEVVNATRTDDCGSGINVAPLEWVKNHFHGGIWKCLIEWPWLAGVIVPYNTDGKIRCERVRLLEIVK